MLEPNSLVMKKVAAFMYGNNVRLSDAVACFNACNGVETVLRAWCDVWDKEKVLQYAFEMSCLDKWEGSSEV